MIGASANCNDNKISSQSNGALGEAQKLSREKGGFETNGFANENSLPQTLEEEAWKLLRESVVYYRGAPIGTMAATATSNTNTLNYDQFFIRDFIP